MRQVWFLGVAALLCISSASFLCAGTALAEPLAVGVPEPFSVTGSLIRMLGGLFLCVGVFGGAIHVYKRYVLKSSVGMRRRLTVLERVAVSQKGSILLVSLDGKEFVVATGADKPRIVSPTREEPAYFGDSLDEACGAQETFNA
jgi:flagellar biogenesis protein FliO